MITCEVQGQVARVTIRRPQEGNALTGELVRKLRDTIRELSATTIVTLTGEGPDFCLGRDRKEPRSGTPYDAFSLVTDLNTALSEFPGILISAVRGRAYGLGVGLVMRSDLALAADDATFCLDEVKLGIPPMFIMAAIGDHLAPKHSLDAVLTSREIGAAEALQMGIVSRLTPPAALDKNLDDLVAGLAQRDPKVLLACKRYARTVGSVPAQGRAAFALVEQTNFAMSNH